MMLLQAMLKKYPEYSEKIQDRKIKIFHPTTGTWKTRALPVLKEKDAHIFTVKEGLMLTENCPPSYGIEFHFVSKIGEDNARVTDFEPQDLHNNPKIKFDK